MTDNKAGLFVLALYIDDLNSFQRNYIRKHLHQKFAVDKWLGVVLAGSLITSVLWSIAVEISTKLWR